MTEAAGACDQGRLTPWTRPRVGGSLLPRTLLNDEPETKLIRKQSLQTRGGGEELQTGGLKD